MHLVTSTYAYVDAVGCYQACLLGHKHDHILRIPRCDIDDCVQLVDIIRIQKHLIRNACLKLKLTQHAAGVLRSSCLVFDVLGEHHLPPPGQYRRAQLVVTQEDAIGARGAVGPVCCQGEQNNQADECQYGADHKDNLDDHCASLHVEVEQHAADNNHSDEEKSQTLSNHPAKAQLSAPIKQSMASTKLQESM